MNPICLQCPIQDHCQKRIEYICVKQNCQVENKILCKNDLVNHGEHIKELIQIENIPSALTYLKNSNREKIESIEQLKKQTIFEFRQKIDKDCEKILQPFLEFDHLLQRFTSDEQSQGLENLRNLTLQLGKNCKIDTKMNQDNQCFLFLDKNFIGNTINKALDYLHDIGNQFDLLHHDQVKQQANPQKIQLVQQQNTNSQQAHQIMYQQSKSKIYSVKKLI